MITFKTLLSVVSSASILIPAVAGLMVWRNICPKSKWFFYFLLITLPFETLFVATSLLGINNLFYLNIFILIEFIFILMVLLRWTWPGIPLLLCFLFGLIALMIWYVNFSAYGMRTISEYTLVSKHGTLTFLSAIFLMYFIKNEDIDALHESRFWIALGIFIYFTSTMVMCIYAKYVFTQSQIGKYYIYFHSFVNISCNIIYAKGFLCHKRKTSFYSTF